MNTRKLVGTVVLTVCGLLVCVLAGGSPAPETPAAKAPGTADSAATSPVVGTASCSGRACHGGIEPGPKDVRQNEFTKWRTSDRHADAYRVLVDDPRSKRITDNLHIGNAWEEARCLACHTNPASVAPANHEEWLSGVGCEACHGDATKWLAGHTEPDWKKLSNAEKEAQGMVPVADPVALAQQCVGCHVGASPEKTPGGLLRDMNHDLIGAGHPRLNFEFSAYLANVPPHWNTEKARPRSADREWAVGQLVSARAALDLLHSRATAKEAPWPEFSEYDCYACHHVFNDPSWRQERGYAGRIPGSTPWNEWYTTMLRSPALAALTGEREPNQKVEDLLKALHTAMPRPFPDRAEVARQAEELDRLLAAAKVVPQADKDTLRGLMAQVAEDRQGLASTSWDGAAQVYLALAALDEARRSRAGNAEGAADKITAHIELLGRTLAFPIGTDAEGRALIYDSPRDFTPRKGRDGSPDAFHKELAELRKLLRP
jgi:hypothetical protein